MSTTTAEYAGRLGLFIANRVENDLREDVPRYHYAGCSSFDHSQRFDFPCDCDGPERHREVLLALANTAEGLMWMASQFPAATVQLLEKLAYPYRNHHDYPKG